MIQNLLAWLPLHAYLSLCHPGLRTLGFIRTVLVEKTLPKLLHDLVRWARSRSAYHLSLPPPFPCLPLSLSCCLTLSCCLSLLLPLSESSFPHWQALIFSSSLLVSSPSLALFHPSLIFSVPIPLPPTHLLLLLPFYPPFLPLVSSELLRISSQLHS